MTEATTLKVQSALPQADLMKRINECISEMHSEFRNTIRKAIDLGDLLREARARVGHGDWEAWLKDNCPLSFSTARRYIKLAEERPRIEEELKSNSVNVTDLSMSAAKRLISPPGKASATAVSAHAVDELRAIRLLEDKLVTALKALKQSNHTKAIEAARNVVRLLETADLIVPA